MAITWSNYVEVIFNVRGKAWICNSDILM